MIMINDRNRKFLFDFWTSILKTLRINFLYSTIYHSQIDDSSERTNRTVKNVIKHYLLSLNDLTKWFKILSRFWTISDNFSFNAIFKTSNEILYEFKSKQWLNLLSNIFEINMSKTKVKTANVIAWSKLNQKRNYDKKHLLLFLKKEFFAYLRMHHEYFISLFENILAKWFQRRIKLFKIIKRIDKFAYRLNILVHWKIHSMMFIQQLKSISSDKDFNNKKSYDNSL